MKKNFITGSMLRDLVQCERRVHHDLHTEGSSRDPIGDFVRMLWEGGLAHEHAILGRLAGETLDLREVDQADQIRETQKALLSDARFILGARLQIDDKLGMPDVLEKCGTEWVAGDIKSGAATERNGAPRREYAVQVAHYASLLQALGAGSGETAFVIARDGNPTTYHLHAPWDRSGLTIAQTTADLVIQARSIRDQETSTRGAISAGCKLCHWHSLCELELKASDDLSTIAGVGRAVRDAISVYAPTVEALANLDLMPLVKSGGRTAIAGLGLGRLTRFRDRARLLRTPGSLPYALRPLGLESGHLEIHFDIETDPLRDNLVYLHGFLLRKPAGDGFAEHYQSIFAETADEEGDAFAAAMQFLTSEPDARIYYYSKYERSLFRTLAEKYPTVASRSAVEHLFDPKRATDLLYDVIMPHTEWPTPNLSIKTLARSLGFDWRDVDASGAASIAWFNEYVTTGDPAVKQRILSYNEDDVRASAVVLDGLRKLPVTGPPEWPPRPPINRLAGP